MNSVHTQALVDETTSETGKDRGELRFFGQVNAAISHDVKNVLAVINEGAGLLDDLCLLAAKGRPVDPEKLTLVARSILGQVKRGDEIVRRMNTFAHSVDRDVQRFNLADTLDLMVGLGARLASGKGLRMEVDENMDRSLELRVDLYALEHLLYAMIRFGVENVPNGGCLTFSAGRSEDETRIHLHGFAPSTVCESPATDPMTGLAESIGAAMEYRAEEGRLDVVLPRDIVCA